MLLNDAIPQLEDQYIYIYHTDIQIYTHKHIRKHSCDWFYYYGFHSKSRLCFVWAIGRMLQWRPTHSRHHNWQLHWIYISFGNVQKNECIKMGESGAFEWVHHNDTDMYGWLSDLCGVCLSTVFMIHFGAKYLFALYRLRACIWGCSVVSLIWRLGGCKMKRKTL